MSLVRIDKLCQGLKLHGLLRYYWRVLGADYKGSLMTLDLKREFQIDERLPKQSSLVIEEIEEETDILMQPLAKTIELGECSWTTNHANLLRDREANVDSNIEIGNDVQCEASISEHGVNEENSDGSVRAKEENVDDGFNEYIDALIGSDRLNDYINPIMEDNMGNFGSNSQDVPCEEVNICQVGGIMQ
ncbi:hypothetical protein GH714_010067 [Hevea brasiliensis]|uniref:Uncharacterized protein n=1 Tax=Hevea brasiliensis TaxID=3981 RepID=A0A6A6LKI5_HEVBR|nr:hypothetical protein GH714_010067 [Hevea brasiliensis]